MKKDFSKRLAALFLAGSMSASVAPAVSASYNAYDDGMMSNYYYGYDKKDIKLYYLNGVYTVLVQDRPVYVFLNNVYVNEYLPKDEAFNLMSFRDTYLMRKRVENANYVSGVSKSTDRYRYVYAISFEPSVSGWTKVNKNSIDNNTLVATTIELGEFIAKDVDLSVYRTNMLGFGYADVNRDGKIDELVYYGNNKVNVIFNRTDAIKFAKDNNLYYQVKYIPDATTYNGVTAVYSLSDKSYVQGWSRISKDKLPNDVLVYSNIQYADANYAILNNSKLTLKEDNVEINVPITNPSVPTPDYSYRYMKKADALLYAYKNYTGLYCILTRTIVDPKTNDVYVMYAFSDKTEVEGWEIIGNDYINSNSCIFLTLQDAYNFEYLLTNGYSKTLK